MFSDIFSKNQPAHPLSTPHGVQRAIDNFDKGDPVRFLRELNEALLDVDVLADVAGVDAAYPALWKLCDAARATVSGLVGSIVAEAGPLYMNEMVRAVLDTYSSAALKGFVRFIQANALSDSTDAQLEAARAAVRAFRALALGMKLQRFFYRLPLATHWKSANDLLVLLSENHLDRMSVRVLSGEAATTPLTEYLYCLYSEVIPSNNLVPMQMELLEKFVRSGVTLDFGEEFTQYSTHMIDLTKPAGPRRVFRDGDDTPGKDPGVRFFSTVALHEQLLGLVENVIREGEVPKWLSTVALSNQLKEAALRLTCMQWMPEPPHRKAARTFNSLEIMVVRGVEPMRTMLAISDKVRKYVMTPTNPLTFVADGNSESSFDLLYRLEGEVKGVQIEYWTQTDSSETGFAATTNTALLQKRIGMPIAFRYSDGIYWQSGVIRRIGRDPQSKPSIGVALAAPNQLA
ncbi:MAG: hypothetical protein FIA96_13580 [Betaproteobacteria bacterium]|nr:hypothetical protein [Betaproteobacteria bacterium]